jgi:hypothetical protein
MYVAQPPFVSPPDPNIRIWRYVDFAKFVSLIDSSTLHFARLDQMEDEYEGAFSEGSFDVVKAVREGEEYDKVENELNQYQRSVMDFVREVNRMGAFVNCWHMNEIESVAMWKIYSGLGIGIQSTFQRLADSFIDPYEPVYISPIKYEDFIQFQMRFADDGWVEPVLYKRQAFEYERELRAFWLYPPNVDGEIDLSVENHRMGQSLNVNLRTLIERVYISPGRRSWFQRLTRSVLDKFGYADIPVVPSALDDVPHTRSWNDPESTGRGL